MAILKEMTIENGVAVTYWRVDDTFYTPKIKIYTENDDGSKTERTVSRFVVKLDGHISKEVRNSHPKPVVTRMLSWESEDLNPEVLGAIEPVAFAYQKVKTLTEWANSTDDI